MPDFRLIAYTKMYEESPGSIGQWQLLTATEGNLRESATETTQPRP
jgi:hypothetical protein